MIFDDKWGHWHHNVEIGFTGLLSERQALNALMQSYFREHKSS